MIKYFHGMLDAYKEVNSYKSPYSTETCIKYLILIQVSEYWKEAQFIKTIQQRLGCPAEATKYHLSSETSTSISQLPNHSLSALDPTDLELPGGLSILILTESDYTGGSSLYKRRLARFYKAKKSPGNIEIILRVYISV